MPPGRSHRGPLDLPARTGRVPSHLDYRHLPSILLVKPSQGPESRPVNLKQPLQNKLLQGGLLLILYMAMLSLIWMLTEMDGVHKSSVLRVSLRMSLNVPCHLDHATIIELQCNTDRHTRTYVYTYVYCMYTIANVCMYVIMHVCMHACTHVRMYACLQHMYANRTDIGEYSFVQHA